MARIQDIIFKRNKYVARGKGPDQLSRLKTNYPMIRAIVNASPEDRKKIIKKSSAALLKTICDICYNLVEGNIELSEKQKKILKYNRKEIRRMGDTKVALQRKKRELIQKDGFIAGLIPALSIGTAFFGPK